MNGHVFLEGAVEGIEGELKGNPLFGGSRNLENPSGPSELVADC